MWDALLPCLLLPFLKSTVIVEEELNAFSLGIDLQSCIKGLTTLGSHAFHFHGFAFHKFFVLGIRERYTLDFLRDVHTIGTQGYNLVGLRVDGDVGGKRFTVLGCHLNGLAKIACRKECLLFFGRELVTHIGEIELWFFSQRMLLFSQTVINFIRSKILLHISTRINISLISDFFIKLIKLPMKFFDTKLMGDLLQRIEDHRRVEQFLTSSSLSLLFSFFTFLVFGVVLAFYNLGIFLVFLLGTILYAAWIVLFLKKRRQLDYKFFEQAGKNRNVTYQLISGMQEIKLQGCEQRKRWEWEDVQADLFKVNLQSLDLQQLQQAGSITINEVKNIPITVLAATAVIQGNMTLGMMLAVQYIIGQLNSPVEQLIQFIYSWQDVSISLDRMNEIHTEANEENTERTRNNYTKETIDGHSLHIKNLSFKYDIYSPKDILSNINLSILNGKVTAIVGASGSGKTTLIKLLLGFYEPLNGHIEIGNANLNKYNLGWWRSQCGAVMQEGYLFSDTIARNIAISDDEPDIERIRHAARVANIADYVEALPLAYNTMIGQDGQGISQGQRQRILIAGSSVKWIDLYNN